MSFSFPHFFVPPQEATFDLPEKEQIPVFTFLNVKTGIGNFFVSHGSESLDAIYVFPASTRAAVHGLRMRIDERIISAQIRERREAHETGQDALERKV